MTYLHLTPFQVHALARRCWRTGVLPMLPNEDRALALAHDVASIAGLRKPLPAEVFGAMVVLEEVGVECPVLRSTWPAERLSWALWLGVEIPRADLDTTRASFCARTGRTGSPAKRRVDFDFDRLSPARVDDLFILDDQPVRYLGKGSQGWLFEHWGSDSVAIVDPGGDRPSLVWA
jgi:hypothetical protein